MKSQLKNPKPRSTFYSEIRDKARTARCASAKISGSKSRKCSLPCDNLTPAQFNKMHGPVKTYRMVEGISDEELSTWPEDLKHEYLQRFR